jgi:hypothetical protein
VNGTPARFAFDGIEDLRDTLGVAHLVRRVLPALALVPLAACWLAASFDGLVSAGPSDGSVDAGTPEAGPGDALDVLDGSPSCVTAPTYKDAVLAELPVAYWRLDDRTPTTVALDSIGQHNGTYAGGVTLGQPGALKNDTDPAATFDGDGGIVTIGAVFPFLGMESFSLEAWIKPTGSDAEFRGIVSNESPSIANRQGYLMYVDTGPTRAGFERWANGTSDPTVLDGGLAVGAWSHIVGTFDGTSLVLYVNGLATSQVKGKIAIIPANTTFVIGALNGGMQPTNFQGSIDEVAVYDHALAADCVMSHYKLGTGL